jgi:polyisoprenoid-binding protein YceI
MARRWLTTAVLALTAAAVGAAPAAFRIDPEHSFVYFEVVHFGTSTLRGRLGAIDGQVTLDREGHSGQVSLRLPTAGVSTGVPALDARLRAADLFDSGGHPNAFFVATQFRFDGDQLAEVRGEFMLRGISQPLSLRALRFGCRADTEGPGEICGGDFEAELLRSEFGATLGLPFVANRVHLLVRVQAHR